MDSCGLLPESRGKASSVFLLNREHLLKNAMH